MGMDKGLTSATAGHHTLSTHQLLEKLVMHFVASSVSRPQRHTASAGAHLTYALCLLVR